MMFATMVALHLAATPFAGTLVEGAEFSLAAPSRVELQARVLKQTVRALPHHHAVNVEWQADQLGDTAGVWTFKVVSRTLRTVAERQVRVSVVCIATKVEALEKPKLAPGSITLEGFAVDTKGNAALQTASGLVYLEGLDSWNDAERGALLKVTGVLQREGAPTAPLRDDAGVYSQGHSGCSRASREPHRVDFGRSHERARVGQGRQRRSADARKLHSGVTT